MSEVAFCAAGQAEAGAERLVVQSMRCVEARRNTTARLPPEVRPPLEQSNRHGSLLLGPQGRRCGKLGIQPAHACSDGCSLPRIRIGNTAAHLGVLPGLLAPKHPGAHALGVGRPHAGAHHTLCGQYAAGGCAKAQRIGGSEGCGLAWGRRLNAGGQRPI